MGLFAAPNRTGIMNALPPNQRGVGAGMSATFQNSAMVLSIGIFFSLMIAGLATTLPNALFKGLTTHGVSTHIATIAAGEPPVGNLFAAFLGFNPIASLLTTFHLHGVISSTNYAALTGKSFFPQLISDPFHSGLIIVFVTAAILSVIGAVASILAGGKYMHTDTAKVPVTGTPQLDSPAEALSDV
jgi:hypothetical protein